jgi:hypothetical protein
VPAAHIDQVVAVPNIDDSTFTLNVAATGAAGMGYRVRVLDGSSEVARGEGVAGTPLTMHLMAPHLWSPDDPHLYHLSVALAGGDSVASYFGMRKISVGTAPDGFRRLFLNNKPLFEYGPLDQGWWPDGLYTPPTEAAMVNDIVTTKRLGFNMIRKHVKVEPARWYYYTDKMGMIVWQDMPSANNGTPEGKQQFERELEAMIEARHNHPSIVTWVPFNEGWGQYDTERITDLVRGWDPSRLIDNPSGWTDKGVGDMHDTHSYPAPAAQPPTGKRASVVGEFGGLGLAVKGHMWSEENWGYSGLRGTRDELAKQYDNVFRKAWRLKDDPGISAIVYTQITDVEHEANGLLTYDREIMKMDRARIIAANTGNLPPVVEPVVIVPTSQKAPATWRYTTTKPADDWMKPDFDDAGWQEGPAGFGTDGTPGAVVRTEWNTRDIWIRRTVTLPEGSKKGYALTLHHDEDAEVYLNGRTAARVGGFTSEYEPYPIIPDAIAGLKTGDNVIAVHCRQTTGGQFIDVGIVKG